VNKHDLSIYEIEVLARFDELLGATEAAYREYRFNEIAQRLYDFFWSDYCDWFIEAAKTQIFGQDDTRQKSVLAVMDFVLAGFLRLLHPFMPHITEELWAVLGFDLQQGHSGSIQFAQPPVAALSSVDPAAISGARKAVESVYTTVTAGRNLRAASRVPSNKKVRFVLRPTTKTDENEVPTISRLLNAEELKLDAEFKSESGIPLAVTPLGELYLLSDVGDKLAERHRLDREIARVEHELRVVETKLSNSSFTEKAPPAVVEEHRKRKNDFSEQLGRLQQARAAMD
jgi:valyl-tRNA synthetase